MTTKLWVGIDWATQEHEVCVIGDDGKKIESRKVQHEGEALRALADWLIKLAGGDASRIAVAIETPRGSVVDALVQRGIAVYAINPKQLDRFRDRHTVAGAKDDRLDAFVLADSLRTDQRLYRQVQVAPATLVQLREASQIHDELTTEKQRLINQMREQLLRYFPQFLELGGLDTQWVWRLVMGIPTPEAAHKNTASALAKQVLKEQRVRRLTADQVMAILRKPPVPVAPGVAEAARLHLESIVPRLQLVQEQLGRCDRRMTKLLEEHQDPEPEGQKREHRDVEVILSLPGAGDYTAATMLSEAWEPLRDRDYQGLRTRGGIAPVTKQSGKQKSSRKGKGSRNRGPRPQVNMRQACNARLRQALFHLANGAIQQDEHAQRLYADAKARGKKHGHALRIVADRLLKVLISMLKAGKLYDSQRWGAHSAAPGPKAETMKKTA